MSHFTWDCTANAGYIYVSRDRGRSAETLGVKRDEHGVPISVPTKECEGAVLANFDADGRLRGVEFLDCSDETLALAIDFAATYGVPEPEGFSAAFPRWRKRSRLKIVPHRC